MKHRVLLACLLVLPLSSPADEATLEEIVTLARGGAPGLALKLIERNQPAFDEDAGSWVTFERERLHILASRGAWQVLDRRVEALPTGVPDGFMAWALERQVEARLAADDPHAARAVLLQLVWHHGASDAGVLRDWRRLIIRSYLAGGDLEAALTALRRYIQDHGHDDTRMQALHAEALLAAGRPEEAVVVLGDLDEDPARALRWLAELRSRKVPAAEMFERAVRMGSARDTIPPMRGAAWRVAAEAARDLDNPAAEVAALERALAIDPGIRGLPTLLTVPPLALWDAYRSWGRRLGNARHLIVGVDTQWLEAAEATREARERRALYAALAADTSSEVIASDAHFSIARSLLHEPGGDRLLVALYIRSPVFPRPESIPATVRQALIDPLLATGDIALASRLVTDLELPPAGIDPGEWSLRRARVLVLGGRVDNGVEVLHGLLDSGTGLSIDRLMQVLFDLQAVQAHEQVLHLFSRILDDESSPVQFRRELYYWMADSRLALGQADEAARLYLRSATLVDPYAMDPWAQTARYQAADALVEAGLREDAIVILRTMMNATDDAARKALLEHRIDQLQRHDLERYR